MDTWEQQATTAANAQQQQITTINDRFTGLETSTRELTTAVTSMAQAVQRLLEGQAGKTTIAATDTAMGEQQNDGNTESTGQRSVGQ